MPYQYTFEKKIKDNEPHLEIHCKDNEPHLEIHCSIMVTLNIDMTFEEITLRNRNQVIFFYGNG